MPKIEASEHGSPGVVVCTFGGRVVWVGAVERLREAGEIDVVHCHTGDLATVRDSVNVTPRKAPVSAARKAG